MSTERQDTIAHSTQIHADKPEWLKNRLEWFQDLKFGLLLHWGPYALWDCCESWPLSPGDDWARNDNMKCWTERGKDLARFQKDYWDLNRQFNPVKFDPERWADAVKESGIRYVSLTTKHHDGFCMWDTATTEYKITGADCPFHTHPKANIFKAFCDAFQSRGMAVSAYFSKADWHAHSYWSPDYPVIDRQANTAGKPEWVEFVKYTHEQIRELMTNYGKIDVLWLDAGWVKKERNEDLDMDGMIAMARELQPGLIVANRTVGDAYEDFITPEHQIPDEPLDQPWESCLCMGQSWKYVDNEVFRPTAEILRMLIEIVSKGGNFLVGFGPSPEGEFMPDALQRLNEIGAWMKINSDAIYGTRAIAPYTEGGVRFTRKQDRVFVFLIDESAAELSSLKPKSGASIHLLGSAEGVEWNLQGDKAVFTLPPSAEELPYPLVLTFEL